MTVSFSIVVAVAADVDIKPTVSSNAVLHAALLVEFIRLLAGVPVDVEAATAALEPPTTEIFLLPAMVSKSSFQNLMNYKGQCSNSED